MFKSIAVLLLSALPFAAHATYEQSIDECVSDANVVANYMDLSQTYHRKHPGTTLMQGYGMMMISTGININYPYLMPVLGDIRDLNKLDDDPREIKKWIINNCKQNLKELYSR